MGYLSITNIRQAVKEGKYIIKTHTKQRMGQRKVTDAQVISVIMEGRIIEEHETAKPFPKCLILGYSKLREPLYVSCAYDGEYAHIITVHWYDPAKWINPWTRRK